MSQWFRLYNELLDDPKIQKLPAGLFRDWINLLCLASRNEGFLPPLPDVSFALRMSESACETTIQSLQKHGLIDRKAGTFKPHNWDERQYKSDTSTERVKRFRKRQRNVTETPAVTDQIQSRADTEGEGDGANAPPLTPKILTFGEFQRVHLTTEQHRKLEDKLNGSLDSYITSFDRWVNEAPDAKDKSGVRRKDRHAYESILSWSDRDAKEGKVKPPTKRGLVC